LFSKEYKLLRIMWLASPFHHLRHHHHHHHHHKEQYIIFFRIIIVLNSSRVIFTNIIIITLIIIYKRNIAIIIIVIIDLIAITIIGILWRKIHVRSYLKIQVSSHFEYAFISSFLPSYRNRATRSFQQSIKE
jgi:hypothetical protein